MLPSHITEAAVQMTKDNKHWHRIEIAQQESSATLMPAPDLCTIKEVTDAESKTESEFCLSSHCIASQHIPST